MKENKDIATALGFKLVDENENVEKSTEKQEESAEKVEKSAEKEEAPKSETENITESETKEPIEKSDKTTDSSEESQEVKTETPSFEDLLLEKSGGKFKNYEDLEKTLSEKPVETTTTEFANEQLEKLNQYVKDGGKIEDFVKTQVDYSELSDMDIIKEKMKIDDPDLSDSDIDFLLGKEYRLNKDDYDEDEVRLSNIKLRKDAREARTKIAEWQQRYSVPESTKSTKTEKQEEVTEQNNTLKGEALEKERARWKKSVEDNASKMEQVDFEINEKGDKFTFKLSDEDRENVKKSSTDLSAFWGRFMNEDGTENINKLNKTMFMVDNFDKIIRAVATQYKSDGKDDVLKDIKNPDYNANSGSTDSDIKTLQQQMYEAWKKGN